ncbi:MAG: agmatine deiminase family protein [Hyphomicrobiales bacterium]
MLTRRHFSKLAAGAGVTAFSTPDNDAFAQDSTFSMPDEAQPHTRTFMQWPVNKEVHPDPVFLDMLQRSIADVANTISEFEPVVMLMAVGYRGSAREKLSGKVDIWDLPTDDLWCRDSGPVIVTDGAGTLAVSNLNFNGWGNKQTHNSDRAVAPRVAKRMGLREINVGIVGEAGGVESDGAGTLIAHESSWVNANRNKGSKAEIEKMLLAALGAEKIIWAPGVAGEDITDYHIDALARFSAPGHIVIQLPEKPDPRDPWSVAAFETYEILRDATDAQGRSFTFSIIPEPYDTRIIASDFVASYVNYYVCNGAVIAAQFGDHDTDQEAKRLLEERYPNREIVMLNVDPIGEVGGGIHCATQQQPAV